MFNSLEDNCQMSTLQYIFYFKSDSSVPKIYKISAFLITLVIVTLKLNKYIKLR